MLPATHRSKTRLGGRVVSLLLVTAALVWILPTLRGGDSLSAQSGTAVAAARGTEAEKANADAPAPGGVAAIRGAWRAVRIEQAGEEAAASTVRQLTLVFDEKRFVMRVSQQLVADAPYTVDAGQNPHTIKLTYAGQATHGIWERKGDTLTLCLADADQALPKKFVLGPDGGRTLLVLQVPEQGEIIPLLVMDADGKNLRTLVALPEYTAIGSSAWSPDGKRIAFDAWRTVFGEGFQHIHEFVANADGTDVRDLGEGRMPSWSPDGKRLALTYYHGRPGIWIVNADGTGEELVDQAGFGSYWCPTGNRIAYASRGSSGANVCVYDLDKAEGRTLLSRAYRQVFWGMAWSPDGQWIAFKADTADGKSELAAVHVDGEAKGFKVLLPKAMPESGNRFSSHIAWGGDGKRVLVGLCHPDRQSGHKLYFLDFAQKAPPQLVPGPYPDGYITGVSLSRDGKKILFGISPSGDPTRPAAKPLSPEARFKKLDQDGNGVLSLDEYLTERGGIEGVRKGKDVFAILDTDHDGKVSLSEFLNPPGQAHFRELDEDGDGYLDSKEFHRGYMPSASQRHAQRAFAALDKDHDQRITSSEFVDRTLEGWFVYSDQDDDGLLSPGEFAQFQPELAKSRRGEGALALLDKDRDGKLSQEEFTVGMGSAQFAFYRLDKDGSGMLSLGEYLVDRRGPQAIRKGTDVFAILDSNHDGRVSLAELVSAPGHVHMRELDDNGDGYLDREEFTRGMMPSASRAHAERTFAAFDKNHDKKLDFPEFADRSGEGWFLLLDRNEDGAASQDELAQGYPDLVRNKHLKAVFALLDKNRDGKLTLAEFRPGVALAEVSFYRQDKDGDGNLALEEYNVCIQTPEGRLAVKKDFEAKDKNRDGKLTLAEFLGSK